MHHNRDIYKVSVAEAALSLSKACGTLGLKLHSLKATQDKSDDSGQAKLEKKLL